MSELKVTVKRVCSSCGKEVYSTQNKRIKDRVDYAMPIHAGSHMELNISERSVKCEACGHSDQMLHIDFRD